MCCECVCGTRAEGIAGLWTGVVPNITRNSVINATELATYDQVKQTLLASKVVDDNVFCHILSGLGAGLCACVVGSPVDVVKVSPLPPLSSLSSLSPHAQHPLTP